MTVKKKMLFFRSNLSISTKVNFSSRKTRPTPACETSPTCSNRTVLNAITVATANLLLVGISLLFWSYRRDQVPDRDRLAKVMAEVGQENPGLEW